MTDRKIHQKRNREVPKKIIGEMLKEDLTPDQLSKVTKILVREFKREPLEDNSFKISGNTLLLGILFSVILTLLVFVYVDRKLVEHIGRIERNEDHVLVEEQAREFNYQKAIGGN